MAKGNQFVEGTQSPESAAAWKQQLDEYAPGASDWVVGAVFGGTYQREGLELRDRQMLNMAALAAMGGTEPQLTGHIRTADDVAGMSKEEVAEGFVPLMPYMGVAKTRAAMRCMKTAFEGWASHASLAGAAAACRSGVRADVDHASGRVAVEEPAHAPLLRGQRMDDLDAGCERGGMGGLDVIDEDRDVRVHRGRCISGHQPDLTTGAVSEEGDPVHQ